MRMSLMLFHFPFMLFTLNNEFIPSNKFPLLGLLEKFMTLITTPLDIPVLAIYLRRRLISSVSAHS